MGFDGAILGGGCFRGGWFFFGSCACVCSGLRFVRLVNLQCIHIMSAIWGV